jgi:hypothetical protein
MKEEKARITRITYCEVKNLGNYENCRIEAEAVIPEGEKPGDVMKRLKKWVQEQLDGDEDE